jgi:arylsulfatase A-like enzyme
MTRGNPVARLHTIQRAARRAGAGVTLGAFAGLANWIWQFTDTDLARAYLVSLLVLGGLAGFVGAGVAGLLWMGLRKLFPRLAERIASVAGSRRRLGALLPRAWAVTMGLGLAILAAYLGSAPRFAGLLTTDPRDAVREAAGPPNVILISLDTTRADHLGAYGYPGSISPSFDALAAGGTLFTRSIATSSWTSPSHASFFTGIAPSHIGASFAHMSTRRWIKLPAGAMTLAELFKGSGYHTAAFIGGPTLRAFFGFDQGFDIYDARRAHYISARSNDIFFARRIRWLLNIPRHRYLRFLDPPFLALANYLHDEGYRPSTDLNARMSDGAKRWDIDAEEVNHKAFRWLDRRPPSPFFLFVHYFDPHDPYEPLPPFLPEGYDPAAGFINQTGLMEAVLKDGEKITPEEARAIVPGYDGEIARMDHHMGRLLDRLDEERYLENSIVAVVSDHGEAFGEHGLIFHGHHLYEGLTRMAFLLAGRGIPAGRVEDLPVSGIDLAPTLLDLAGLSVTGAFEGRSLRPLLEGDTMEPVPLFAEVFGGRRNFPEWEAFAEGRVSVEMEGFKMIRDLAGEVRLYDIRRDPGETDNIVASRADVSERLSRLIDGYLARAATAEEPDPEKPPQELIDSLRGLGYVE